MSYLTLAKLFPKPVSRPDPPLCGPGSLIVTGNRLLAAVPRCSRERLLAKASHVKLQKGQTLYEPGDLLRYAYFPTSGLLSFIVPMQDGKLAAVASTGCEGIFGVFLVLGETKSDVRCVVESPGSAWKIDGESLVNLYMADADLRSVLERHIAFRFAITAQFSACNRLHSLQQRLANWLLRCERLDCVDLHVTHEFLSQLFGVQRTTVTSVLQKFQQRGLIRAGHGHLIILDPNGLQSITCECYARWLKYLLSAKAAPTS
jgi:CRP-like cAMP-binding protein